MAYNYTPTTLSAANKNNKHVQIIGQFANLAVGLVDLSGASPGVATVTIPGVTRVVGVAYGSNGATNPYTTATSANTFSVAGGTSDVVFFIAYTEGGL